MGMHQALYTELRTRYMTGWTPVVTEYPNERFFKPNPAVIWARFGVDTFNENALDIGAPTKSFRTNGELVVQLFAPLEQGCVDILAKADTLASVFRNWCGEFVMCREASIRNIGNDGNGWYQVNVIVSFKVDSIY